VEVEKCGDVVVWCGVVWCSGIVVVWVCGVVCGMWGVWSVWVVGGGEIITYHATLIVASERWRIPHQKTKNCVNVKCNNCSNYS
jgi:hypothetical protein